MTVFLLAIEKKTITIPNYCNPSKRDLRMGSRLGKAGNYELKKKHLAQTLVPFSYRKNNPDPVEISSSIVLILSVGNHKALLA